MEKSNILKFDKEFLIERIIAANKYVNPEDIIGLAISLRLFFW